jgi:ribose-phosphate pyrophosphokinase
MNHLAQYLKTKQLNSPVIICPDKGAMERSKTFAQFLGMDTPVIQFEKKRDVKTGEIVMQGEISVKDKDVIIADDIIATGGTMALALKIAKKGGAKSLYAIGTHPLLTQNAVIRILGVGTTEIIGTDSIISSVMKVSLAGLIAQSIRGEPIEF